MTEPTPRNHADAEIRFRGRPGNWVAFIRLGSETETRVRFRDTKMPARYRCDKCGRSTSPSCVHARIAGAVAPALREELE